MLVSAEFFGACRRVLTFSFGQAAVGPVLLAKKFVRKRGKQAEDGSTPEKTGQRAVKIAMHVAG